MLSMASEDAFDPHLVARDTVVDQLDNATQLRLAAQARDVVRQSPLVRPRTPNGMEMRIMVSAAGALGWVGDGAYRYDPVDSRGKPWPALPEEWAAVADRVAGRHPWDSAIINWYPPGSSLGWHRDIHEADRTLPIVTISLGDACSWAIRADEESPVCRCRLETGHVTLLAGEKRLWLHTVERVIRSPMFSPLGGPGRLSITIRVAGSTTTTNHQQSE